METRIPTVHTVKWKASLSNGETFYEDKAPFEEIENQPSPWTRFVTYVAEKKATITSLALYTEDGRTFNLPSLGKNPNFQPFREVDKPIDYQIERRMGSEISGTRDGDKLNVEDIKMSDWFTVAIAIYPTYKLQLWVDNQNPKNCWVLVV